MSKTKITIKGNAPRGRRRAVELFTQGQFKPQIIPGRLRYTRKGRAAKVED